MQWFLLFVFWLGICYLTSCVSFIIQKVPYEVMYNYTLFQDQGHTHLVLC